MWAAVKSGDAKKLAELMRQDPGFDVNMALDGYGRTLLHHACLASERSPVIPLLLAHPGINVNSKNNRGYTPFSNACCGRRACVREMLKDSRVKVNEPNNRGSTPLWIAARYGYLDVIKWWIASGREIHLGIPGEIDKTEAIGLAKKLGFLDVASLLERFKSDPAQTRHATRLEIRWYDSAAAKMFALVVFVSDGLLQVKDTITPSPTARFFSIARRLPLELQMVLCFRQVGSDKEIIRGKASEAAFKELARKPW